MAVMWYYAHDENRLGPFSPRQLKDLADAGTILSSDTVWKDGVEQGVLASRVRNLFAVAVPSPAVPLPMVVTAPPRAPVAVAPVQPLAKPKPPNGKAVALKGADIVSQDGTQAKYRKKCVECGFKDASCQTITISNKTTKGNFFCRKCRRRREVVIQCHSG